MYIINKDDGCIKKITAFTINTEPDEAGVYSMIVTPVDGPKQRLLFSSKKKIMHAARACVRGLDRNENVQLEWDSCAYLK